MSVLFLSYAREDAEHAASIAGWLRGRGLEVYYFQDPERRGGRFIEQIETAIRRADAFLVLLSPSYLTSGWCRREQELAMAHEGDLRLADPAVVFLHVLMIAETPLAEAGFLRSYDWQDLMSPASREAALAGLVSRLGNTATPQQLDAAWGRKEELAQVERGLSNAGGPHFWLIVAPPGFGKSWFVQQLSERLAGTGPPGRLTRLVDLRNEPSDLRRDADALLRRLLGLGPAAETGQDALRQVGTEISQGQRMQLCVLDSAELLDAGAAAALRSRLSEVWLAAQQAGSAGARLALVVASRLDSEWRGVIPAPRMAMLRLSGFGADTVRQGLRDLARQAGHADGTAIELAGGLVHQLSEGVPALLEECLQWIRREGWAGLDRLGSQELFEELAESYIQARLFSQDSLGPASRGRAGRPRHALEQAFQALAPFRIITQSHLRGYLAADPAAAASLAGLNWSASDLWQAISQTALLTRPLDEPWQAVHPAIRKLLFRYYYATSERQAQAHEEARTFVATWAGNQVGTEQAIGIVERLWHEAALLRITRPEALEATLSETAETLFGELRTSAAYSSAELRAYAAERIRNDAELQAAIGNVAGLSAELADIAVAPTYSSFIHRPEELRIRAEADRVRQDRQSRAVLVYGAGGAGKTWLVRQLALAGATASQSSIWLEPIDLDDPQYWLLSSIERQVCDQLDPESAYFGPYRAYLAILPRYARKRIDHDTVVGHLGRIKRIFAECYRRFVEDTGRTVVLNFDTVEAIRGTQLMLTLAHWMKVLPATLFIISGRPPGAADEPDEIRAELESPYQYLPVTTVHLGGFSRHAALDYLNASPAAAALTEVEKAKLALLTRGHPLWLAFASSYLMDVGLPAEAETPLGELERELPYEAAMTELGARLHAAFLRRLVAPFWTNDFWHEAVRRLAVVRQGVSQSVWEQLMAGRPLPEGTATWQEAWETLLRSPWIRPRSNGRFVTVHDAVAEELAQRVIPLHDQDRRWRRQLWRQAAEIFTELARVSESEVAGRREAVDRDLRLLSDAAEPPADSASLERNLIQEVAWVDAQRHQLLRLQSSVFHYRILSDFADGTRLFLELFSRARRNDDTLLTDLFAFEMQRFLPGGYPFAFGDVVGTAIDDYREWLSAKEPGLHLEVGLSLADYLIGTGQSAKAIDLLTRLPAAAAADDPYQTYRLNALLGRAGLHVPGRALDSLDYLRRAATAAESADQWHRPRLMAAAHQELGTYYWSVGRWDDADEAYQQARGVLLTSLGPSGPPVDRQELAEIYTSWGRLKGLTGSYREGSSLTESAIEVFRQLDLRQPEGISWLACGEVYRYERRFDRAWTAYAEAERIFQGQPNWNQLGYLFQEQAICLIQASADGISLVPGRDPAEQARRLITLALDICRDRAVRGYPSALNRAGRIFGPEDPESGLSYLEEGIEWARRLSDGRFWYANLIEYAELCYRTWVRTAVRAYRDRIDGRADEIGRAGQEYSFPDLTGRWCLLQGHLATHDYLDTADRSRLAVALGRYKDGFTLLALNYVGSSGASAVGGEFAYFRQRFALLPEEVQAAWLPELRQAWAGGYGSTLLLARLAELY